jgi:hypothetical protein
MGDECKMQVKPLAIDLNEVALYLRLGTQKLDAPLADKMASMRETALKVIRPARIWRRIGWPKTDGTFGASLKLARHLAGCHAAYLVCGTLGTGFDALLRRVSVMSGADALVLQAVGTAAVEEWMDCVENEIRAELAPGETLVRRYSPGYGDFPLAAQRELLGLLDAPRTVGVSLTDTLLMAPSKSVSAVIGVKRESDS